MPKPRKPRMSDAAGAAKTSKTWSDWFAVLDRAGAKRLEHRGIVALLGQRHGVGASWQQMVTVTYDQARDALEVDETPVAVEVSRSKTLAVPIARLWGAWQEAERARWLGRAMPTVRKIAVERLGPVRLALGGVPGRRQLPMPHAHLALRRALRVEEDLHGRPVVPGEA